MCSEGKPCPAESRSLVGEENPVALLGNFQRRPNCSQALMRVVGFARFPLWGETGARAQAPMQSIAEVSGMYYCGRYDYSLTWTKSVAQYKQCFPSRVRVIISQNLFH